MKDTTKDEASRRLRTAMARLEAVERHLDAAAQSISVVEGSGVGAEWEKIRSLLALCKATGMRIREIVLMGKFDLDDLARSRFPLSSPMKAV